MVFFLGANAGAMKAQEAVDYHPFHKIDATGEIRFRLMPANRKAFAFSNRTPQTLEVYAVAAGIGQPPTTLLRTETLRPLPRKDWEATFPTTYWDTTAFTAIYLDELPRAFVDETFLSGEFEEEDVPIPALRLGFANFAQNQDFSITEKCGLGLRWVKDTGVVRYGIKVYPTPSGDTLFHEIDVANYTPPPPPELEAKFKDRQVKMQWDFGGMEETYYGYQLFRSLDGGDTFTPIYENALINGLDSTLNTTENNSSVLIRNDVFEDNGATVVYRLHGADYLGGYSERYDEEKGVVGSDIELSPIMGQTIQTDSNYAVLNWTFNDEREQYLQEFRILHRPSTDAEYTLAIEGIDPAERSVAVPMKFRSNFYRVEAVSLQGTKLASFESLVLMYDVDPPAVPKDFVGSIDSNGIVRLSWTGSNEPDLNGYYLFKGFFRDTELAMITPDALKETRYVDTVSMETGNDTVFYQLRSVDLRGNGSNFTPRLALVKPDIFPPSPPQIKRVKNDGKSLTLFWTTSPSPDVVSYRLYRKSLTENGAYELIQEWPTEAYPSSYTDSLLIPGQAYGYALQAVDDAGLLSEYSQPASATLKDFGLRSPIQNLSGTANPEEKNIRISWEYQENPREFYLYKGQDDQPVSLLKIISGNLREYVDEAVRKGSTYRYMLRAIFPNGKVSPFTEEVIISLGKR